MGLELHVMVWLVSSIKSICLVFFAPVIWSSAHPFGVTKMYNYDLAQNWGGSDLVRKFIPDENHETIFQRGRILAFYSKILSFAPKDSGSICQGYKNPL